MQDIRLPASMQQGKGYMRLIVNKDIAIMQVKATPSRTGALVESGNLGVPSTIKDAFVKMGFADITVYTGHFNNPLLAKVFIDDKGYIKVNADRVYANNAFSGSTAFFIDEETKRMLAVTGGFTQVEEFK